MVNSKNQPEDYDSLNEMGYARLNLLLTHHIDNDGLIEICSTLQISINELKLHSHSSQKEFVIAIFDYLIEHLRIDELFAAFNQNFPTLVQEWRTEFPSESWALPYPELTESIRLKINELLEEEGEPYFGSDPYADFLGCYCWSIIQSIAQGQFPDIKYKIVERLRTIFENDPVTIYAGNIVYSEHYLPEESCIVVAPTMNQFDIIRIEGTCGPTQDISWQNIIDELLVIDERFGVEIFGANDRSVVFKLRRQPDSFEQIELTQWFTAFADEALWSDFSEYIELIFD